MTQNTNTATQLPETLLETLQKPKTKLQETQHSNKPKKYKINTWTHFVRPALEHIYTRIKPKFYIIFKLNIYMETINSETLNQLSQFSIEEIEKNSEKVFDLIQLSKAREDELNSKFISEKEAYAYLDKC